jgi:hypothetical protein
MDLQAELARMRAETEQSNETMKELAGSTRVFFSALVEAGFSEDHALQLTQTWLAQLIQSAPMSGIASEIKKQILGGGEE